MLCETTGLAAFRGSTCRMTRKMAWVNPCSLYLNNHALNFQNSDGDSIATIAILVFAENFL